MTALAPNQPFIRWSPGLGLWVAFRYGYVGTGDDKEEAAEVWAVIFENLTKTGGIPAWPASDQ